MLRWPHNEAGSFMTTFKRHILIACAAAALSFGGTTLPAAAENASAHQETKMMRHRPMMHHRAMMRHHKRMMMHHKRMMHRSM
jgi:hypothetical protein